MTGSAHCAIWRLSGRFAAQCAPLRIAYCTLRPTALPAVDRSKRFAGSSACARSKVEQQFAASEKSNGQMTLAEIEQAKHAASWLNSLATNLATTGAALDRLFC
jgi:hypothetical protein